MTDTAPNAVLDYLNAHARTDTDGAVTFHDDDGTQHVALDREGCPPMTAREVAAWTKVHRPELWGSKTTETKAETAPSSTQSAADLMGEVRSGRLSADDAARRLLDGHSSTSTKPAATASKPSGEMNFTTLMTKARAGDNAALDALKQMVHTR